MELVEPNADVPEQAIAIIGIALRAPSAETPDELWDKLREGLNLTSELSEAELRQAGVPERLLRHPHYVRRTGRIADVAGFDPELFGFTPREAALMDPQLRHLCECTFAALEDAAIDPARPPGPIGLFVGVSGSEYLLNNLLPNRELVDEVGLDALMRLGNDRDFVATRIAYALDLRGPCMGVQAACASGALSVHSACQSLLGRECRVAVAAAASLRVPHDAGYLYEEGGLESPDGECRTFDRAANGTLPSSAVAVLTLCRLEDALASGHHVYAVIRATACNNDGRRKVGYAAPSVDGPLQGLDEVLAVAGLEASDVGYVEAHGTGTPFGDSIEVNALTHAFRQQTERVGFCVLGANKPNLGHTDAASGLLSVIKASYCLATHTFPPLRNFEAPHPMLDLEASPFRVVTEVEPWPSERARRALVNCLAVGGTNLHILLEEPPPAQAPPRHSQNPELLLLSAHSPEALLQVCRRLAAHLTEHPEHTLADVAYTLRLGRRRLSARAAFVVSSREEAIAALQRYPEQDNEGTSDLHAQGRAFCQGQDLDTDGVEEPGRRRLRLPTYPFEHRRFWIEPPAPEVRASHVNAPQEAGLTFARSAFVETPRSHAEPAARKRWLVFMDETGLGERAVARLTAAGCGVTCVRFGHGADLSRDSDGHYRIDCDRGLDGFRALLAELAQHQQLPDVILHLWMVTTRERFRSAANRFHHNLERGYVAALGLAQGLSGVVERPPARLVCVTNGALSARGERVEFPEKALAFGPLACLPREETSVSTLLLDVDLTLGTRHAHGLPALLRRAFDRALDVVLAEAADDKQGLYALRSGRLLARCVTPAERPVLQPRRALWRPAGTYLVVGGFGGIGQTLAHAIAKRVAKPRLVLVGRTPIPDRDYFDEWLADHGPDSPVSRRIQTVRALEAAGAQVLPLSADVCHLESMRSALTQVARHFGPLHGVFHVAGTLDEALLATRSVQGARDAFAAEVLGSRVLRGLLSEPLDFLVTLGHAARFAPRAGMSARLAAAEYAHSSAHTRRNSRERAYDLGLVRDAGMYAEFARKLEREGATLDPNARALAAQIQRGVSAAEMAEGILDALAAGEPHLVIGQVPEAVKVELKLLARNEVRREYVAPEGPIEIEMARIWAQALGLDRVGATDNFFDLGGHSLVAVRLGARVKAVFGVPVPLALLLEAPTVRVLSQIIAAEKQRAEAGAAQSPATSRLTQWSCVVPMQPKGARPPLFCVGGKGGNVMNLRHLATLLGEDQPVYGLQARGVDGITEPHRTIAAMVDEYVSEVRKLWPQGPYFLAGFSGGGAIVVDMARTLLAQGYSMGPLFFLDAWNPATPPRTLPQRLSAHAGLFRELGPRYLVISGRRFAERSSKGLLERYTPSLAARIWEPPPDGGHVLDAWDEAIANHVVRPLAGDAVLFRVRANRSAGELDEADDEFNGWGDVILGAVEVIDVPGDHNSLLEEPHVRTLAQRVRASLDRALRKGELAKPSRAPLRADTTPLDAE